MVIFGLTGGIGSGKSLVASYFSTFFKAKIFDADKVVHELYKYDSDVIRLVSEYFPDSVDNGIVDRNNLRQHFLTDNHLWVEFQSVIHAIVLKKKKDFIMLHNRRSVRYVVLDIPLLIESNFYSCCDFIIHVTTSRLLQMQRVLRRGLSIKEFESIRCKQLSESSRKKFANFTIRTGLSKKDILFQIKKIMLNVNNKCNMD
ncbi:dephospho-CoA kinase [Ehrlichia canis]|uniref:Dephospho-CoA kinase n=1 Tax=Ehrlichia canis (strain Jake) TaxID=269484 RepID=COAE_EHRCJ|nr:dephospho-CoA kinase [Ehrlichia canis]Q3YSI1.1 RecName: Full=Dephospho-CoA kinase; AltName: Full=Dephosphocoenzyme A kinase [Ehrlichia canis str. Jake]AAZ68324.1 Dephospho-CoA kinase [Ehrlichia canis str. Jake]AUO54916.1 dephospho-CoA kinase [Ehrlichia canis]UKC53583.1 coaE [Ehrlichia canis]UKC54521.1 coaE [Ehrlichia canis]UKC55457.1 coaE [Ehrlichia canis]